ncbi:hypothetical protein Z043_123804, partial [Scleropages formosus]
VNLLEKYLLERIPVRSTDTIKFLPQKCLFRRVQSFSAKDVSSALGPRQTPLQPLSPLRSIPYLKSLRHLRNQTKAPLEDVMKPLKVSVFVLGQEEHVPSSSSDWEEDEDEFIEAENPRRTSRLWKNLYLDVESLAGGLQCKDGEASEISEASEADALEKKKELGLQGSAPSAKQILDPPSQRANSELGPHQTVRESLLPLRSIPYLKSLCHLKDQTKVPMEDAMKPLEVSVFVLGHEEHVPSSSSDWEGDEDEFSGEEDRKASKERKASEQDVLEGKEEPELRGQASYTNNIPEPVTPPPPLITP